VIVDALLGTGASGPLREDARAVVQAMDAAPAPVVAADVPSGVDASTGEVADVAVRCAATATFHLAKPGLWIAPGKAHAGRVREVAIGMPPGAPVEAEIGLIGDAALDLVPRRDAAGTKFSSGAVLVAGGSRGLTGAVCLAALGAMRAGAGYVTVGVPEALEAIFEVKLTEAMSVGLPAEGGAAVVLERAERVDALVLGSGLGREERALAFAREVAAGARLPLVLDADGLNAHAGALEALAARPGPTVLTPHAGELGRLLGVRSGEVAARRLHHVREAARRAQAVVALKGDDTLVAEPGGRVAVSPGGAPGLATAGTGDVLAGVVGALLAKGLHPWPAACAAVLAHVRAGQRAATAAGGADGLIAGDVATALPAAFARA
jgi:NAD(P)H-hydrate epimerase